MGSGPPSQSSNGTGAILNSWKEIAAYLGISVRAAQMWEDDLGLPVRRRSGVRGRVWALAGEVDEWRARIGQPSEQEERIQAARRRAWRRTAGLAAILMLAAGGWVYFRGLPGWNSRPASWRVDGLMLIVRGENGRDLWRYRLPHPPGVDRTGGPRIIDLDGDGRDELLFPFAEQPASQVSDQLLCFSSRGKLLWSWRQDKLVKTRVGNYDAHYSLRAFLPFSPPGERGLFLLAVASHGVYAPSSVTLLDQRGRLLREYWHFGHLEGAILADVDADGRQELVLPGISNAYRAATLVVLDPTAMDGASLEPAPDPQLLDFGPPIERARLIFGRTSLNRGEFLYNVAVRADFAPNRLEISVDEAIGQAQKASIQYVFGLGLSVESANLSDGLRAAYNQRHARGQLPSSNPDREIPGLIQAIRFITPWH